MFQLFDIDKVIACDLFYFVHLQVMVLRMAFIQVKFVMVKNYPLFPFVSQCPKWEINNEKIWKNAINTEQKVLLGKSVFSNF